MRIAGVRLDSGQAVWVDAGEAVVAVLDRATVQVDGGEREGDVFLAPDQVLAPPERLHGMLLRSRTVVPEDDDCETLPGAEMPVLGQVVRWRGAGGTVVALDPVGSLVTVQYDGDTQTAVPRAEISVD